eukprot:4521475-Karenia_brevis.AAC.2
MRDVAAGLVRAEDKHGNDMADKLAVAGAAQHCIDEDLVRQVLNKKRLAKAVQSMMLSIIKARAAVGGHGSIQEEAEDIIMVADSSDESDVEFVAAGPVDDVFVISDSSESEPTD